MLYLRLLSQSAVSRAAVPLKLIHAFLLRMRHLNRIHRDFYSSPLCVIVKDSIMSLPSVEVLSMVDGVVLVVVVFVDVFVCSVLFEEFEKS